MMNQDILIRPFDRVTDTEILSSIWFDASMIAHPFIGKRRLLEQRQLIADEYLPKAETWVACHSDDAIGFISLLGSFIGGLFIAPDRQGMGAGRKLVAHALALKGELSLEVYTENEQAVRFYTSLGFSEVSRRDVDDFGYPYQNAALHLRA
ncbi:GNAT family N-acetyltransferase [Roseinatronobacter alkalisoli]|uniref:GNAT family N-acetyltransferase n=1 Tax=Roseinatronobacter alkalisoli TaxID=3028235 RepID=A0ABT5TE69_9RHOB|nr:GNAT family N-acetyltransferase [Roseinatronobacter sp. HJB301]MDD7972467.1 GNAT family N-acetyltransferase [Roseinatronobacter sp. HJB301]